MIENKPLGWIAGNRFFHHGNNLILDGFFGGIILRIDGRVQAEDEGIIRLVWGLVNTTALLWEFAEFFSDRVLGSSCQLSLEDTLMDLFLGMLGGMLFLLPQFIQATQTLFRSPETSS